jgi:hypothetical protein
MFIPHGALTNCLLFFYFSSMNLLQIRVAEEWEFQSCRVKNFLFSTSSKPALGPLSTGYWGLLRRGVKLTAYLLWVSYPMDIGDSYAGVLS